MLGLEVFKHSNVETKAAKTRMEIETILRDCIEEGHLNLDIANLAGTPAVWEGRTVSKTDIMDSAIGRKIVWELHEVSFRWELLTLDQRMYRGSLTRTERDIRVLGNLPQAGGSIVPLSWNNGQDGFGAPSENGRRASTQALYQIMSEWHSQRTRSLPKVLHVLEQRVPGVTEKDLMDAEEQVVAFYINTFVDSFERAPVIPHRL
jgi:hypothetical protein